MYGGNYFCQTEFSGGGYYNEQVKKWQSTTFKPDAGFLLSLKFKSAEEQEKPLVHTTYTYNVAVTDAGAKDANRCSRLDLDFNNMEKWYDVDFWDGGVVICRYSLYELRFNPENRRFLQIYPIGFIDGKDVNDNTPNISGGTCTKIPP